MITEKATRCQRWVWAYVSRYPHLLSNEIVGATTDYSEIEVKRALVALERLGYVEHKAPHLRGWVARVPFVVSAPEWVAHP